MPRWLQGPDSENVLHPPNCTEQPAAVSLTGDPQPSAFSGLVGLVSFPVPKPAAVAYLGPCWTCRVSGSAQRG